MHEINIDNCKIKKFHLEMILRSPSKIEDQWILE